MINRFRNWIKNWLFKEELEKIGILESRYDYIHGKLLNLFDSMNVGVDIDLPNTRHQTSWAVVCIASEKKNSPDYIRFISLHDQDMRQIRNFLEGMEKHRNAVIDCPMSIAPFIKGERRRF